MLHEFLERFLRGHSFATAFAFYACGIIASQTIPLLHFTFSLAALVLICGACEWRHVIAIRRHLIIAAAAVVLGYTCGSIAQWRVGHRPFFVLNNKHVVLEVLALERPRIVETASMRARVLRLTSPSTNAAQSIVGETVLVDFPATQIPSKIAGSRLLVRGRVDIPAGPRNEGERSERETLADQGVAAVITVHRDRDLLQLGSGHGWEAWWARARQSAASALEHRLAPLEATVLEGILWGDRGNLPAGLRQEFADTGTVHVLTTAGLHLGFMAAFVAALLSLLPIARPIRVAVVLVASWMYAALAGMHLPTVRAATMLTAGLIAQESGRGRSTSAILAAAACAVTLPHPLVLLSPSFSMSFSCVAGIALLNPILLGLGLRANSRFPHWAAEVVRTSVSVQVALWPLQALYFNAFTPYAVLANLAVVPLVGCIMAAGSALAVASLWLPVLAISLANLISWGLTLLIGAVNLFARLPHSHIDVPPPTHTFLVCYWISLAAIAWSVRIQWWQRLTRFNITVYSAIVSALLIFIYCLPGLRSIYDRDLHLDAIDVGQADCLLLRAPGGHAMLVDGGGRLERTTSGSVVVAPIGDRIATRTVLPFLLRHWVLRLDTVVLTHPHGDHAGGLPLILERERVDSIYDSAQLYGGPAYHRMLAVIKDRHITWKNAKRGQWFALGPDVRVDILAPELPLISGTSSDINNNSVVLRVRFGKVALLMTGDAQAEAEARLLSHGADGLRADVLKVGHHGSAYSSTKKFLEAVKPKIAIISCGLHNVFGHPSPATLAALRSMSARILRTDLDGGISLVSDGDRLHATTTIKNNLSEHLDQTSP